VAKEHYASLKHCAVKSVKPMLAVIEMLRRDLVCMSIKHIPQAVWETSELRGETAELAKNVVRSLAVVEQTVLGAYQGSSWMHPPIHLDTVLLEQTQRALASSQRSMRLKLQEYSHKMDFERRINSNGQINSSHDFSICLFVASLLQIADEAARALEISTGLAMSFNQSQTRLWLPHLSLAWLGMPPRHYVLEVDTADAGNSTSPDTQLEWQTNLSTSEASQGVMETTARYETKSDMDGNFLSLLRQLPRSLHLAWSSKRILHARLALSSRLRKTQRSEHIQHGFKNAAGVALLSIPAFLPEGAAGRKWFQSVHGVWAVRAVSSNNVTITESVPLGRFLHVDPGDVDRCHLEERLSPPPWHNYGCHIRLRNVGHM
jgi:hypothetical protein